MKSILFNLALSLCAVAVCSCNDESIVENHQVERTLPARTPEEAMAIAKSFFCRLNTRGGVSLDSLDLQIVRNNKLVTRGGGELSDTSFYIVNGNLGTGYVLLSGNRNIPPVVSYSPNGNLREKDLREESELWGALNRYNRRSPDSEPRDLVFIGSPHEFEKVLENFFRWRNEHVVVPMLKTEWGQKYPYNNQAPIINGERCVTGCSTTAIAQVLNHYKYPSKIGNYKVDWEAIANKGNESSYNQSVSGLFYNIGRTIGVQWGVKATGIDMDVIHAYLRWLGYNEVYKPYDDKLVQQSLLKGHPVIAMGAGRYLPPYGYVNGHVWIIDGWQKWWQYAQYISWKHKKPKRRELNYYHINWGWNGVRNGYFVAGVFDTSEADSLDHKPDPKDGHKYRFYNLLACIVDIYPKK